MGDFRVLLLLQLVTVLLIAVAFGLSLAHALEYPGKLHLNQEQYFAVQAIYYPGFTFAGAAEPLALLATVAWLFTVGFHHASAPWLVTSFLAMAAVQGIFWFVVQPVNRIWTKGAKLGKAGEAFFRPDRGAPTDVDWTKLRGRWEYGHIARAVLGTVALVAALVALSISV